MNKFEDILLPLAELLDKKNHDYGNSYDKLRTEFGEAAFLIRLSDKLNRLIALSKSEAKVTEESKEDTIKDIVGYCTLELNYRRKVEKV